MRGSDVWTLKLGAALTAVLAAMAICFAPVQAAEEYKLGAGDTVRITAYNNTDLTTEARIAEDGSIPFPLLGRVTLGGLTKSGAEQKLSQQLTEGGFLRQAAINLTVLEYRSQQVSVLGAVGKPGKYPISSATSVLDILAEAGGIAENGSSVIRLVRRNANGESVQHEVDLNRAMAAGNVNADLAVTNGDVIFVAEQPIFYIYGEVQKPGEYPLKQAMTMRQAIAIGGGLTEKGTERRLRVSRKNKTGKLEVYRAELSDLVAPGDVLQVKEALF